ncbi:MAG: DsbA family protein [Solirubrobacteraceae bacterium]
MSVASHQQPRATRARRLALVAAVAVAAVVIAAVVSSSGGSSPAPATPAAGGGAPTNALFTGIPEKNGVLGDPSAPVTITEFVDLQCPICAETSRTTLPQLIQNQVKTGEVKLDARALQFIGPDSVRAAQVAAGAREQGRLWPFLAAFYAAQGQENSGYATDDFLRSVAQSAGVNADEALAYAQTDAAADQLNQANSEAQTRGIDSTPSFVVTGKDGKAHVVVGHDDASLNAAIKAAR